MCSLFIRSTKAYGELLLCIRPSAKHQLWWPARWAQSLLRVSRTPVPWRHMAGHEKTESTKGRGSMPALRQKRISEWEKLQHRVDAGVEWRRMSACWLEMLGQRGAWGNVLELRTEQLITEKGTTRQDSGCGLQVPWSLHSDRWDQKYRGQMKRPLDSTPGVWHVSYRPPGAIGRSNGEVIWLIWIWDPSLKHWRSCVMTFWRQALVRDLKVT